MGIQKRNTSPSGTVRRLLLPASPVAFCLLFPSILQACLPSGDSWTQTSPGGKFLLVMVSSDPLASDAGNLPLDADPNGMRLRDKYRESGLYRNDGSTHPLWAMPFIDSLYPAEIAPDGSCVAFGPQRCPLGQHVVTLYVRGRCVGTFLKGDLISCYGSKRLLAAMGAARDLDPFRGKLDAGQRTYTITTGQGEVLVLDVRDGRVLQHRSPWPPYLVAFVLLVPGAAALVWYRPGIRRVLAETGADRTPQHRQRAVASGWTRFSLKTLFVAITLACVLLAVYRIPKLGMYLAIIGVIAGGVAAGIGRSIRSFVVGGMFGCYGCILAFLLVDFFWNRAVRAGIASAWLYWSALITGVLLGSLFTGILERRIASGIRQ